MEDAKRTVFSAPPRNQEHKNHRHLQTDTRSVAARACAPAARPFISLKARMLGGQAETITRLRAARAAGLAAVVERFFSRVYDAG